MSTPKSLSPEQISHIQAWADEGDGLPEIQKKLRDEFEIRVTYLETRFLLEDLKIELKPAPLPEAEPEVVPEETESVASGEGEIEGEDDGEMTPDDPADEGAATAKVSVDALLRPDAIISGKVDFGAGHVTSWWLDQMGRLGMDPIASGFRPSEAQALAFQDELRAVIQKSGL